MSTGIILLLSSILLASLPTFRRQAKTNDAASTILIAAQDARQKSITVKQFQGSIYPSYGLSFDTALPQSVTIYADCVADDNADGKLDNLDSFVYNSASTACGGASGNGFLETRTFDSQVKITQLRIVGQISPAPVVPKAYIEFIRPQPSIWITGENGGTRTLLDYGSLEITVKDDRGGNTKIINLYTSGRMEIQ